MDRAASPTATDVVVGLEPYESDGPRRGVTEAEAELVLRDGGLSEDEFGLTAAMFDPPTGAFLVARSADGLAVGGAGVRPFEAAPGTGEIKRLWVESAWRSLGIGRVLMERIESTARARGLSVLTLASGDGQPEAVALYEVTGWKRDRHDHTGAGLPNFYFQFSKRLT